MPHDTPLITTIVAALVLAYIFGAIANRLKMPPLVGYLIAGVCVGPHSPGFVADQTLAPQLAEIGVILLMFGVGLEFSLRDLLSVKAVAIPGAILQIAAATALGWGLATLMGWSLGGGLVFGLALSVSSTVVLLKALQERHLMDSDRGRIAVGWLIVEDLAMVLALVLIPALAGVTGGLGPAATAVAHEAATDPFVTLTEQLLHMRLPLWGVLGVTVVKLLAFVGFMLVVGRRVIPFILHATAHTGSRELFRLAVLAIALGVAAGAAYLFGVSLALGAFFAGMILSESELSHRAAQETLPLRDAFGVLFFVSVGMLFDPSIILRDPLAVLATLAIILLGKSLIGFVLLVLFRRPVAAALTISASLAQIGEFSFILVALGVSLGLLPEEGRGLVLAGAIISIVLNPLAFWVSERLRPRLESRVPRRSEPELGPVVPDREEDAIPMRASRPEDVLDELAQPTRLANHVVLIGYGRVGTVVAGELHEEGAPFVLIEDAEGRVLKARAAGVEVIVGNAATGDALRLANVMGARCVVVAIPNAFEAGQAVEQCRKLNAAIRIIARAHSEEEIEYLHKLGADEVIMGEREIGLGMIDWLKGQAKGEGRREAVVPPLAGAGNLLRDVREAHPATDPDVATEPLPFDLDHPSQDEPPARARAIAVLPNELLTGELVPAKPAAVEPVFGRGLASDELRVDGDQDEPAQDDIEPIPPPMGLAHTPTVDREPLSVMRTRTPDAAATPATALAAIAGQPLPLRPHPPALPPVIAIGPRDVAPPEPDAPSIEPSAPIPPSAVEASEPEQVVPEAAEPSVALFERWAASNKPAAELPPRVDPIAASRVEPVAETIEPAAEPQEGRQTEEPIKPPVEVIAGPAEEQPPTLAAPRPEPETATETMAARFERLRQASAARFSPWPRREASPSNTDVAAGPVVPDTPAETSVEPPVPSSLWPESRFEPAARAAVPDEVDAEPVVEPQAVHAVVESVVSADELDSAAPALHDELQGHLLDSGESPAGGVAEVAPAVDGLESRVAYSVDGELAATEGSAPDDVENLPRPSPGFRVVPSSEIVILPPEPSRASATDVEEEAVPTFRSEFWAEPYADGDAGRFAEPIAPEVPLRDVRDTAAARAVIEGGSWLEALEHDLFGDSVAGDPPSPEIPPADPEPVEPPRPAETPATPQDPIPAPEPVEPPAPAEVPGPGPAPSPEPRALGVEDHETVDVYGRREPRIY